MTRDVTHCLPAHEIRFCSGYQIGDKLDIIFDMHMFGVFTVLYAFIESWTVTLVFLLTIISDK